jgi:ribulose-phosphate 3-epimerase
MNGRARFEQIRESRPAILPSMLQCDFGNLQAEVDKLIEAGAKALHLDVMDGHFVPNLSYGLPVVAAFRRMTDLPIDVHLMIANPEDYVKQYCDAGADSITFHIEATDDPEPILHELERLEVGIGLAANPHTPVSRLEPYLPLCDLALVMSVEAGFGGQAFDESALKKISTLRQQFGDRLLLQVDGGINQHTIARCAQAGADLFVVGSAIFNQDDYRSVMQNLVQLATV